ncbi:YkvA family protein [Rapidithrix thailandica]|uniref:YkvA family protein n=1 Tax=Rapidithrix thailandica TaxID=413964 RepID=A0AAW9SJW2_9BACT
MKKTFVFLVGLLSLVYLLNPTAGLAEFIPDNIPFVGNIDEATAVTLLLASLRYFGIDLGKFLGKQEKEKESLKQEKE